MRCDIRPWLSTDVWLPQWGKKTQWTISIQIPLQNLLKCCECRQMPFMHLYGFVTSNYVQNPLNNNKRSEHSFLPKGADKQLYFHTSSDHKANFLICLKILSYLLSYSSVYKLLWLLQFSCSVVSDSLRSHESQHARPPCPSPTPGVHSNSCPSSQWCHPAISSSGIPFSSCPQSLLASESFPWVNSLHEVAKVLEFQL